MRHVVTTLRTQLMPQRETTSDAEPLVEEAKEEEEDDDDVVEENKTARCRCHGGGAAVNDTWCDRCDEKVRDVNLDMPCRLTNAEPHLALILHHSAIMMVAVNLEMVASLDGILQLIQTTDPNKK